MFTRTPLNLFVTVDKLIFREAILLQLVQLPYLNLVGESSSGADTLKQLALCAPNLLIIEEDLQGKDGLTLAEIALSKEPSLIIILLVETEITESRLKIYLESGVASVVPKTQPVSKLIKTIHYVRNGQSYIDPEHLTQARTLIPNTPGSQDTSVKPRALIDLDLYHVLSEREQEVAGLIAARVSIKEIAERLELSHKTVHTYKERILVKMGFEQMSELLLFMKRVRSNHQPSGARNDLA